MKLMISTQVYENYGAHDWNGEGECPQYWKAKGGDDYFVRFTVEEFNDNPDLIREYVAAAAGLVEDSGDYYREYVIGHSIEADDFLTEFEKDQQEYDGKIAYPAKELFITNGAAHFAHKEAA